MTTYITLSLIVMLIREIYANKGIKNISFKSWVWVCLGPITLPITIGYAFYSANKELKSQKQDPLYRPTDSSLYK